MSTHNLVVYTSLQLPGPRGPFPETVPVKVNWNGCGHFILTLYFERNRYNLSEVLGYHTDLETALAKVDSYNLHASPEQTKDLLQKLEEICAKEAEQAHQGVSEINQEISKLAQEIETKSGARGILLDVREQQKKNRFHLQDIIRSIQ